MFKPAKDKNFHIWHASKIFADIYFNTTTKTRVS